MAVGVTVTLPLTAPPVSKLVPTQAVASVLLHVSWLLPPRGIASTSAPRVAVTAGPTLTVWRTGAVVAPPAPVQVTE